MKTLRIVLPLAAILMLSQFALMPSADAGVFRKSPLWLKVTRKSGWGWGPGYHVRSNPRPNSGMYHQFNDPQPEHCHRDQANEEGYKPSPAAESYELFKPATEEADLAPSLAPANETQPEISLDADYYERDN